MRILFVLLLLTTAAQARWKPEYESQSPDVKSWFEHQHNLRGQWCCNNADGHPYYGDYTVNADGSVTIDVEGTTRVLPEYMVLKGANPTGSPVYWYTEAGGARTDYCFALGGGY